MKKSFVNKFGFVFFILIFSLQIFAQSEPRITAIWSVSRYDINVTLPTDFSSRNVQVSATLNLTNIGAATGTRLTLRLSDKAEVLSAKLGESIASISKSEEKLTATRNLQRIVLSTPATASGGSIRVGLEYKLRVDENSGLSALSPISTQFLPLSFWYPTPNSHYSPRGADFAPFTLSVTGTSNEFISSGETRSKDSLFEQKQNGQPFFVIGDWDSIDSKLAKVFLPKGAGELEKQRGTELANLFSDASVFASGLLGSPAVQNLKIVAVRRGAGFADAGTLLLEYGAFRRNKTDANTAMTIVESAAKIYLGNVKAIRGEGFGFVREGLARYIATQFIEKKFGKEAADLERLRQRTSYASVVRREVPLILSSPLDDSYFATVPNKGAMVWRLIANQIGQDEMFRIIRTLDVLSVVNLRKAFSSQEVLLSYFLDQSTDMNLMAGLPQQRGAETIAALRNLGSIDAAVGVAATNEKGEVLQVTAVIPALSFGQALFRTSEKITRVEVDPEKYYPQVDFSDDVAPREFSESDPVLVIKRAFDKQDFIGAERNARLILKSIPHFDDARILLARSLQAQGKLTDAEQEYRGVLNEKVPTARSLAWANVGLGEILSRTDQKQAVRFFDDAIKCEADYGAALGARLGRNKIGEASATDESVRNFFAQFDKAVVSSSKASVQGLMVEGEVSRFAANVSGQAQAWQSRVLRIDRIDANCIAVETSLNVRLLNKGDESGTAVFELLRIGNVWKLGGVEMFEVR